MSHDINIETIEQFLTWREVKTILLSDILRVKTDKEYNVTTPELPYGFYNLDDINQYQFVKSQIKNIAVNSKIRLEEARDSNQGYLFKQINQDWHQRKDGWLLLLQEHTNNNIQHLFNVRVPIDPYHTLPNRMIDPPDLLSYHEQEKMDYIEIEDPKPNLRKRSCSSSCGWSTDSND
uniref:Uncharacterized protein n=1 Tax=Acrobeloides nanus TaxID=290746 RepID=A0A914DBT3_9BILA